MLPLLIFNELKQVLTDTRFINVLEIMNKEKEEHCHYSGLPSPKAYAKDDIDYDGMGNQGRVPMSNEDKKDWFVIGLVATIFITWSLIIISMFI